MTDNEIIKALEVCSYATSNKDCEKCPYYPDEECVKKQFTDILDLINRQKAEINRLQKKANTPFAKITFDRDKLQEIVDEYVKNIEIDINLAKSEAIEEFAEKLKSRLANLSVQTKAGGGKFSLDYVDDIANQILHDIVPKQLDDLVKEMTEVEEK